MLITFGIVLHFPIFWLNFIILLHFFKLCKFGMYNIYFYFYIPYNMLTTNNLFSICHHTVDPLYPTHHTSLFPLPSPNHYSGLCKDVALGLKQKTKAMQLDPQALESD